MTRSPCKNRLSGICVGLLLLTLITPCASAAGPKRVLILDPFERDVAPFHAPVSAFRSTLAQELGERVDFYEVPLDLLRFDDPEKEGPLVAFLEGRLKNHPVDLVVPIGGASVQFAASHRGRLFPDTPVLLVAPDPRMVPPGFLRTHDAIVTHKVNLPGMIEDILQMEPQTTNIAVVFGSSLLERFWANECRREFQPFTNRVKFTWLDGLSLKQLLGRCAALPPHSFILHVMFLADAEGVTFENQEAIRRLHETANAPIFGYFASDLGMGAIGGRLYPDSAIGSAAGRAAIRMLHGERPEGVTPQLIEATAPTFDWRELQRWNISEARLPAGSIIRFRQPGFWELYRWPIAGTFLFSLLQAALIVGLLVNRAKRRQGEAEATLLADISSRFVNLPPGEVDGEIMDAERRICELLDLDLAALWQWSDESPGVLTPTHVYTRQGLQAPGQMRKEQFPWYEQQMLAGRTVVVSSLDKLPAEATVDRETCRLLGIKSNLTLPLSVGGKPPVGILGLNALRRERDWPDPLIKRLQMAAQIFANALARKQTEATLHDLTGRLINAHEAERARLARELHDDITQRLARLAIDAGRVQGGSDGASAGETMRSVRDGLVRLSEDIHSLSYRLHPSLLEDLGLAEALKAECERFSRQESVATALNLRELPSFVPPDTALCLFRVAQEALRNVARHARARGIEVSIRIVEDGLQLAVIDDGIGFEPASPRARHSLGLAGMRERLLLLGGELEIESTPGKGTTILAWAPLQKGQS